MNNTTPSAVGASSGVCDDRTYFRFTGKTRRVRPALPCDDHFVNELLAEWHPDWRREELRVVCHAYDGCPMRWRILRVIEGGRGDER